MQPTRLPQISWGVQVNFLHFSFFCRPRVQAGGYFQPDLVRPLPRSGVGSLRHRGVEVHRMSPHLPRQVPVQDQAQLPRKLPARQSQRTPLQTRNRLEVHFVHLLAQIQVWFSIFLEDRTICSCNKFSANWSEKLRGFFSFLNLSSCQKKKSRGVFLGF